MLSETLTCLYRVVVTQGAMVVVTPALEATVEATLAQAAMEVANLGVWAVTPALEATVEATLAQEGTEGTADQVVTTTRKAI